MTSQWFDCTFAFELNQEPIEVWVTEMGLICRINDHNADNSTSKNEDEKEKQ